MRNVNEILSKKLRKLLKNKYLRKFIKFGTLSKIQLIPSQNRENLLINSDKLSQKLEKQCKLLISENYR